MNNIQVAQLQIAFVSGRAIEFTVRVLLRLTVAFFSKSDIIVLLNAICIE